MNIHCGQIQSDPNTDSQIGLIRVRVHSFAQKKGKRGGMPTWCGRCSSRAKGPTKTWQLGEGRRQSPACLVALTLGPAPVMQTPGSVKMAESSRARQGERENMASSVWTQDGRRLQCFQGNWVRLLFLSLGFLFFLLPWQLGKKTCSEKQA